LELKSIRNGTAKIYPTPGGIIKTLTCDERKNYKCISIDGVDRCINILDSIKNDEVENYFIEMSSCAGGCLGGPCKSQIKGGFLEARSRLIEYMKKNTRNSSAVIVEDVQVNLSKKFINKSKPENIPDEDTIQNILISIGKFTKDKELNCGACGYSTCREKAIAVYNKKAQLYMCLPFMRERAESISNLIINTTPNAILAMNKDLIIQEINSSALKMFNLDKEDMKGKSIYEVLDCLELETVKETGENILEQKYYYKKYDKTVEQSIVFSKEQNIIVIVIKDLTEEEKNKKQLYKVRTETVDIAQKLIEKQMRVAQEIASLLGETTAETKVALTKLKNSMILEMSDSK
jgi:PAS domain S-box-containing protein